MSTEKRKLDELCNDEKTDKISDSESGFTVPYKHSKNASNVDDQIREAKVRVKEKEEILRKLKLVRMYRSKWETQDLDSVTAQWLRVSQEALEDLRAKVREKTEHESGHELTLASIIQNLGLDPQLLRLHEAEDCFLEQQEKLS